MKKVQVCWSDDKYRFLGDAKKVTSSKADFTGLGYQFHATITIGDDGFANACRITERLYQLGTWHKWDWAKNAELKYDKPIETLGFNVTPSKIQSKLKSHGITGFSVADLENSIKQCCIDRYNDVVRWEIEKGLQLDFDTRCNGFLDEFKKLKEKYALKVKFDTYCDDYDQAGMDVILEDNANLPNYREKYVTQDFDTDNQ